jgi:hypothetical protein
MKIMADRKVDMDKIIAEAHGWSYGEQMPGKGGRRPPEKSSDGKCIVVEVNKRNIQF